MSRPSRDTEYKNVRSLTRGLLLLECLNAAGRDQTAVELSEASGLHRTTVRRLLHTLVETGFVVRSEAEDTYRLTRRVRNLSEGYTAYDTLSQIAMPIMGELMQKVVWPSSLCVPDLEGMQIWESTHRFSPFSFHRGMRSRRIPFLRSASGRAYFCFCDEPEQIEILRILSKDEGPEGKLARDKAYIRNLVQKVRQNGYSTNLAEWEEEKKVGAVSMPIFRGPTILGSLTVIFLANALTLETAIDAFLEPLDSAVKKISIALSQDD